MMFLPLMMLISYNLTQCQAAFGASATTPCWLNYTITCLTTNVYNYNSIIGNVSNPLGCVTSFDSTNFPTFWIYWYIVLEICLFFVFAVDKGRRAYIGAEFLAVLVGVVTILAKWMPTSMAAPIFAIFIIITALIMLFGAG